MKIEIREMKMEDAKFILEVENNPAVWKVSHTTKAFSLKDIEVFIAKQMIDGLNTEQKRWIIMADGQSVGCIDIFDYSAQNKRAGVGIVIHPKHQNKGIAKHAVNKCILHCTEKLALHQLYCTILEENTSSIKLFEGLGFKKSGHRKDWTYYDGQFHDELFYQLEL
jgi:diamine N-acetyltransferase